MRSFFTICFLAATASGWAGGHSSKQGNYPEFYLRGEMTDTWSAKEDFLFTRNGDEYSLSVSFLNGQFKIGSADWVYNFGSPDNNIYNISDADTFMGKVNGRNLYADNLSDVTIKFKYDKSGTDYEETIIYISANGHEAPNYGIDLSAGALPVLHINVYKEGTNEYNNEVIDRNLSHKNYFSGEYWLDMNGCEWMEALGAKSIGSAEEPLPLEIKARGNYTRTAYSKKPFKLKLGKKQSMLGLSKSKHFAILAHADDSFGYLRNFTGFNLGRRIGLPWTPDQQPVEVFINGDYRGLYFLTESIRVEDDRVEIAELKDLETDPQAVSGGYLVELDNYDEDNQIRMEEKSFVGGYQDVLRITWDTPEEYSDLMKRFITDQFTEMNNAVGSNSNVLWSYMDLDDAVRYYLVEEIMSHTESYHGSTYLFRDRGENQKWHFSPLWDFGNAFNGPTEGFFYHYDPFGNTWIDSMRENKAFNLKLKETWNWFMNDGFNGIFDDIDEYADHISEAAKRDHNRWGRAPRPDGSVSLDVRDNSDMPERKASAVDHLKAKINWLKSQFGDYTAFPHSTEPQRDTTPAAPLPDYVVPVSVMDITSTNFSSEMTVLYNLEGMRVEKPEPGNIYIAVTPEGSYKVRY